jgi:multiple sugar transport system substrate-binding protein
MSQPRQPLGRTTVNRRRLLAGGGLLAAGLLAGDRTLAAAGRRPLRRQDASGARRPLSGEPPTLSQWYHEYGEEGVLEAVQSYAADYPDANVEVEWIPGDWETAMASGLLTDEGPDVFEWVNGPNIDMIQGGQVVPLDGVLGDAADDFDERLISRMTYDGHLWAVPQMIDMHVLVFRRSLLDDAGIEPPATMDDLIAAAAALTTGDVKGLFVGNDGGIGLLAGYPLWSAGADYLTEDNQFGFATDAVYESFAKLRELFESDSLLLGAPTDWSDPGSFINQLTAMQLTGLWTFPQLLESEIGDDFDVIAWPQLDASTGTPSLPYAALSSTVSARSVDVEAAKAFVQWLWVDQADKQLDFATSYGFHLPVRFSLREEADQLASGPAATTVGLVTDFGRIQEPLLWTPASRQAYNDARARIIAEGADPETEIAAVREVVEAELERVQAGAASSATVPATTG